jgi:site-specific recombinase XerD
MNNNALSITNLINGFRLSCQTEGKSPNTIEWYICFLNRFRLFLESREMPTHVQQIDKNHIRAFILYLQTEARVPHANVPLSGATVQGYVRTLKAFFSWLAKEDYIPANPMTKIPAPKAASKVINTFTVELFARLAEACHRANGQGNRDLCLLLLMLDCGVRLSEVVGIEMKDINLSEGCIKITTAKGGKERMVPIGSLVQKSLWRYINADRPKPLTAMVTRVFLSDKGLPLTRNGVQQMMRRKGREAGITGVRCSPHTLRHSFAKHYLLNGGDIFSLQKILGHSSQIGRAHV